LRSYFWPKPSCDYACTVKELKHLEAEGKALAEARSPWNDKAKVRANNFAKEVFAWGRVPQKNVTAEKVERVVDAALARSMEGAPMNSGWSKVAAFVTAHLEAENRSQAIWDSRVSRSVVQHIDVLLSGAGVSAIPAWLRHIGKVQGRNKMRWSTPLRFKWPNAYGRWNSHIAAADLIRELRDELNNRGMPALGPYGEEAPWTVRSVEMVLFMDGY
jgi:hypothetical protein